MFVGFADQMPLKIAQTHAREECFLFMFIKLTLEGNPPQKKEEKYHSEHWLFPFPFTPHERSVASKRTRPFWPKWLVVSPGEVLGR